MHYFMIAQVASLRVLWLTSAFSRDKWSCLNSEKCQWCKASIYNIPMNSKTTGWLTEEKSVENYWCKESTSGSGNPWAANCRKLGKHCSCNFPSALWLTTLGDGICVRMTVGLTDYNCSYVLILYSCVPWEEWIGTIGNGGLLQHPVENCPQQSVSPWQICSCLLRLSLLTCQELGMRMSHPLVGLSQVQDKAGPQDGTSMYQRWKKWKKTGFSFWHSPNSCSKSLDEKYLQRKHQAFRLTHNMS